MKRSSKSIRGFFTAVNELKIQGASAVAKATLTALVESLSSAEVPTKAKAWQNLLSVADQLSLVRPTEPMARNLARWFVHSLEVAWRQNSQKLSWLELVDKTHEEFNYRLKEIEHHIAEVGSRLVKNGQVIFTHCHSHLAENILVMAKRKGKRFTVYHTETRPLFQGRTTAQHLKTAGIRSTMVVDSAAAWAVSNHAGDDIDVDWVLLGSDSVAGDGSAINKIGSFGIALSAYDSGVPVYVATSLLKFDVHNETKLELRPNKEIWAEAPAGIRIVNYAFDRVPAKYIDGFITEAGLVKPNRISQVARRTYPDIFK